MEVTGQPSLEGQPPIETPSQVNSPVQVQGEPAPEPIAEPTTSQVPDDRGTVSRMQQEIAKYRKVFQGLNIDPESDFADQFIAGVIGKDEVARNLGVAPQPQAPALPVERPHERLAKIINKVRSEGATEEDFATGLSVMADVLQNIDQSQTQAQQASLLQQCETAVRNVISADTFHTSLPEEVRALEAELFLASTDYFLGTEARKTTNPQAFLTPQGYAMYANKNAERMDRYRQHLINHGKQLAMAALKQPNQQTVQPISPSTGGSPVMPAQPPITRNNMRKAAQNYLAQRGVV
ncbi:MAG: hypothetical protein LLF76_02775 [Planctomycetaceae bacterium]|nr:hypothetical protein [Planctomycetaceae bacterium]